MPEIPDCLHRRYRALDELIEELSSQEMQEENIGDGSTDEPGIKLMCDFWNILKEDPDCNLTQAVKQRMGLNSGSCVFKQQRVTCYLAGKCSKDGSSNDNKKNIPKKDTLKKNPLKKDAPIKPPKMSCSSCSTSSKDGATKCCERDGKNYYAKNLAPLSKVLCNLKEAASYDKQCFARVNELMNTQKELQAQIQKLENREKEGIQLLKEADCMWTSMEEAYKKKVAESLERQGELIKQLQEVEASNAKWRKNKRDLEGEMKQISKCHLQITEKIAQKHSDIRCLKAEIADYKRRIDNNKKDVDGAGKVLSTKKQASDKKIAAYNAEAKKLINKLAEERKHKQKKEAEGQQYVKEAREDLQKICRVLLQNKLENEDLLAERDALEQEIELLKQTCNLCEDKCKNKHKSLTDEIKKLDEDIILFGGKCIRCHQITDTVDIRKYCSDCPRCKAARECLVKGDYCEVDPALDCVCMSVKEKFLDNIFENMYTVLERQARTDPGKAIADMIVASLRNSKNGKLDKETRKVLQDFVLTTVRKNLNLTIIGGAVKTRCEMEPETYKQLMLCLTKVSPPEKAPKADKGTVVKKESCRRWGSSVECNCPGGPKLCICTKRAPPKAKEASPIPPPVQEDEEFPGISCPHIDKPAPCGPDCAQHTQPGAGGRDLAAWRPDPCSGPSCHYSKNMRAAQCVLGPESLNTFKPSAPYNPETPDNVSWKILDSDPTKSPGRKDLSTRPREIIIEEVMGSYDEVTPTETAIPMGQHTNETTKERNTKPKKTQISYCSYSFLLEGNNNAKIDTLRKKNAPRQYKRNTTINTRTVIKSNTRGALKLVSQTITPVFTQNIGAFPNITLSPKFGPRKVVRTESKNAKQLKDGDAKCCDNSNCSTALWQQKITDVYRRRSILEKAKCNNKKVLQHSEQKLKQSQSVSPPIYSKPRKSIVLEDNKTLGKQLNPKKHNIHGQETKDGIKHIPANKGTQLSDPATLLTTSSGNLAIELDEDTINFIDIDSINNPNTFILLRKSDSGHIFVHSDFTENTRDEIYRIKVKRSLSGTLFLEVEDDFIDMVAANDLNNKAQEINKTLDIIQKSKKNSVIAPHAYKMRSKTQNEHKYAIELTQTIKDNNDIATIKIENDLGVYQEIEAPIKKTRSGNTIIEINNFFINNVEKLINNERGVVIKRSDSGVFILNKSQLDNFSNAILRKTASGDFLLIVTDSVMHSTGTLISSCPEQKFHKVKIRTTMYDFDKPPTVLKTTASHNYILIPDKEYLIQYKQAIQDIFEDNTEYHLNIARTDSDNYVLDFDDLGVHEPNALIVKYESGEIKIIMKKAHSSRDYGQRTVGESSKVIDELLDQFSRKTRELNDGILMPRLSVSRRKSSSDSNIYEKVKLFYPDHKELLTEPPAILKETSSGQYAIVLDKESKYNLVKNLRSFLKNNIQSLVPIKKTDTGEITIDLNSDLKNKSNNNGTLKITPSGNIFVIVNEELVKKMRKESLTTVNKTPNDTQTPSKHLIGKINRPVNKSVTTTCNAVPEKTSCIFSQCACSEIKLSNVGGPQSERSVNDSGRQTYDFDWRRVIYNSDGSYKVCDPMDCTENCSDSRNSKTSCTQAKTLPHIVIKPTTRGPVLSTNPRANEQCFYVMETNYQFTECKIDSPRTQYPEDKEHTPDSWDSLEFLPPQLPEFLKDLM